MTKLAPLTVVFALLLAVGMVGCSSSNDKPKAESITVVAADSLKGPFTEIGERFKSDNPGASVEFTFGNSADLVLQLAQGTRADVFASGDRNDMVKADQAELVDGKPVDFGGPSYYIAVLKDSANPTLAKKFVDLVTGEYGQKALSEAGIAKP